MNQTRPKFPAELSGFAFSGEALSRADALRDDPVALSRLWPQSRVIVLDTDGSALADETGKLLPVTGAMLGGGPGTALFLGLLGDVAWFAVDAQVLPISAPQRIDLRRAAASWPAAESGAFAFARATRCSR